MKFKKEKTQLSATFAKALKYNYIFRNTFAAPSAERLENISDGHPKKMVMGSSPAKTQIFGLWDWSIPQTERQRNRDATNFFFWEGSGLRPASLA